MYGYVPIFNVPFNFFYFVQIKLHFIYIVKSPTVTDEEQMLFENFLQRINSDSVFNLSFYFRSLGETCPVVLRKTFIEEEDTDTAEMYLSFFHNAGSVFTELVKKLEEANLCITDVYEEVRKFRAKIMRRKEDEFFGFKTKQMMDKQLPKDRKVLAKNFVTFYGNIISYLDKWFDVSEDNIMTKLKPIGLYEELTFPHLQAVVSALGMSESVDMDQLYEEYCESKEEIDKARIEQTSSVEAKWIQVFQTVGKEKLSNMFLIVSYVLSIPGSNAFVERIFSLMNHKWSDCRNRCSVELMKSELQVTVNCTLSCKEFFLQVQSDKKLLNSVKTSQKYPWKK